MAVRARSSESCLRWKVRDARRPSNDFQVTKSSHLAPGLVVEKVDWQSQEVIVHAETAIPTYEEVEAKIAKTGVSYRMPADQIKEAYACDLPNRNRSCPAMLTALSRKRLLSHCC